MIRSHYVDDELSRMGAMQLLAEDNPKHAAILAYRWLLIDSSLEADVDDVRTPNLYDMLSYLLDKGTAFGFTYRSRIERGCIVFTITNNKLQDESRIDPILLELFIAYVFEQLSNVKPEIKQSGNDTDVRIKLPRSS